MESFETGISKIEKRRKDKSQIATVDKVLDPKTMKILEKLEARQKLFNLSGSISTGKEANVYSAMCSTSLISKFVQKDTPESESIVPVVLKIYKTSTMLFKDRTRYIIDEKRFKNFCTSNSRKLIKLWAEKEVRNLKRLAKSGIPCPKPLYLKRTVLIMSMIGDTLPAHRLKDVVLNKQESEDAYSQCIGLIKDMYQKARLIHADFSEYNLLYHNGKVYVIDVSQSMDVSQENSNTFLVMDLCNCNDFFSKKGVVVKGEVELFEEITGLRIPEYLKVDGRLNDECFIPTRIIEVANKEDIALFMNNDRIVEDLSELDLSADGSSDESVDESIESDKGVAIDEKSVIDKCEDENTGSEESIDVDLNEIDAVPEEIQTENTEKAQIATFALKSYSDLSANSINLYVRRLRLKNPEMSKEEEKAINKVRKSIVKEMNRERRIKRVQRKEEFKHKNKKNNKR